jgi:hypothetical protein
MAQGPRSRAISWLGQISPACLPACPLLPAKRSTVFDHDLPSSARASLMTTKSVLQMAIGPIYVRGMSVGLGSSRADCDKHAGPENSTRAFVIHSARAEARDVISVLLARAGLVARDHATERAADIRQQILVDLAGGAKKASAKRAAVFAADSVQRHDLEIFRHNCEST